MKYEHAIESGASIPKSMYFSIQPLSVVGPLGETLKGYHDFALANHFRLHNDFLCSENKDNALVEMLMLGVDILSKRLFNYVVIATL